MEHEAQRQRQWQWQRQEGKSPIEHGELTESSHAHPPDTCLHLADRAEANLGYFSELRGETISKGNNYTNYDIAKDIAPELCDIWSSAAAQFKFPVILGLDSIANKIKKLLVKAAKTTNRLHGRTSEIQKTHDESTNLFDIIKCRYVYSLCLLLALFWFIVSRPHWYRLLTMNYILLPRSIGWKAVPVVW